MPKAINIELTPKQRIIVGFLKKRMRPVNISRKTGFSVDYVQRVAVWRKK
jgi:hypothetical protein